MKNEGILYLPFEFYLRDYDRIRIDRAKSFFELGQIAIDIISRMTRPVVEICGPITTGGLGDKKLNVKYFALAVAFFTLKGQKERFSVFNQLYFEKALWRLGAIWLQTHPHTYCKPILEEFYRPIMVSGVIDKFLFMPTWESSIGTKIEKEIVEKASSQMIILTPNWETQDIGIEL